MNIESFKIHYPHESLSPQVSEIFFMEGKPDLSSVFKPGAGEDSRRLFVTDASVASLPCMEDFIKNFDDDSCGEDRLLILGSGEPYKTIESVLRIVTTALEAGFNRKDTFVGIGGGVICDITAFAASIYKRGTKVEFVPTTLLAMVDASVGGKTGCDFDNYKNMIGTFYPAQKIYYWPEFIQSLSENQYKSGLAEAFKTAILFNKELFDLFCNESEKILLRDSKLLHKIISECVKAKATIVEKDFYEKNIRAFLNLGHTFAHALESVSGLGAVTHGEAVAWGIGRVTALSNNKGYCLLEFKDKIFKAMELYGWDTNPIPSIIKGGAIGERLINVMHKDKKNKNSKITLVIPKQIADITMEETDDSDILMVLK